jgi:hypothetical protein
MIPEAMELLRESRQWIMGYFIAIPSSLPESAQLREFIARLDAALLAQLKAAPPRTQESIDAIAALQIWFGLYDAQIDSITRRVARNAAILALYVLAAAPSAGGEKP